MKKNIFLFLIGTMLVFVACEPIEKRNTLAPAISEGDLDSKISIVVDGNDVNCSINDGGVVFWKTSSGVQSNIKEPSFYFPLAGTYQVSCTLFGGAEKVSIEKDVIIAENDPAYYSDPMWELLTNNADGKTWVWATDGPVHPIWGVGPHLVAPRGEWWGQDFPDLEGQGARPDDEMTFDLNKAHNFSVTMNGDNANPGSGTGFFDMKLGGDNVVLNGDNSGNIWSYGKITFTNHTIPLGFQPNGGGAAQYEFDILKLTADELVLAFGEPGAGPWGAGWFYQFKRKGYTY